MWDLIHVATVDVQLGYERAFNRWYNDVHVPELLECPGWLTARRFECTEGQPRFLAIYGLSNEDEAFGSAQYAQAFGWDEFATRIRNSHGRNYRLTHYAEGLAESDSESGQDDHALIHVASVDVQRGYGQAFDRWYNEVHVPELLECPGWLSAKRFECTDGQPRFLAIYELSDEDEAFGSAQYAQAFGWDEFATRIRNSYGRNYRLIHQAESQVFDQTTTTGEVIGRA